MFGVSCLLNVVKIKSFFLNYNLPLHEEGDLYSGDLAAGCYRLIQTKVTDKRTFRLMASEYHTICLYFDKQ